VHISFFNLTHTPDLIHALPHPQYAQLVRNPPDCQDPESIDVERAQRAKERAEGRLANPTPDIDVERAEAALQRALLRLHVTKML